MTMFQKVPILAVGTVARETVGRLKRTYRDVSVGLTAEEAEALVILAREGTLTATLRNADDPAEPLTGYVTIETLINQKRADELSIKRQKLIQIIRGGAQ